MVVVAGCDWEFVPPHASLRRFDGAIVAAILGSGMDLVGGGLGCGCLDAPNQFELEPATQGYW
jgi:hypothetical protein